MTEELNARSFGAQAKAYAAGRPGYPDALFDWIAEQAPAREAVWDVATGNGQAAISLAERFETVFATDIDPAQLAEAKVHDRIKYTLAPSEASGLASASVDAVTAAAALHWFSTPAFWAEVGRVLRPGGLFCAWVYDLPSDVPMLQAPLVDPVREIVDPYWAEGNRKAMRGYQPEEMGIPLTLVETPRFACDLSWTPEQVIAFMRSWSAHKRAREDGHEATLSALEKDALKRQQADRLLAVRLPLYVLAGRKGG